MRERQRRALNARLTGDIKELEHRPGRKDKLGLHTVVMQRFMQGWDPLTGYCWMGSSRLMSRQLVIEAVAVAHRDPCAISQATGCSRHDASDLLCMGTECGL